MATLRNVRALTIDLFGTVLDLQGSLDPFVTEFLKNRQASVPPDVFHRHWRARQRIEQYQDTIIRLGHSGYLETARRALVYTLKLHNLQSTGQDVQKLMLAWQNLSPFPDVLPALERLKARYTLVALSNGDPGYLEHLIANRIGWDFDDVISSTDAGGFKPHPAVYRRAAMVLGLETGQCMMISSNSFDVMGARACGFRGAFVNRDQLPYEETPFQPDVTVNGFTELADALSGHHEDQNQTG